MAMQFFQVGGPYAFPFAWILLGLAGFWATVTGERTLAALRLSFVTSFIAGKYETVPKKMFNELILEVNPTITAVATLLVGVTVLALAAVTFVLGRAGKLKQTIV